MIWALIDEDGFVRNTIEYNGVSPYNPPEGMTLLQVNNWVGIGDHKDKQEQII